MRVDSLMPLKLDSKENYLNGKTLLMQKKFLFFEALKLYLLSV